jgi:hypothetical protein
MNYIIPHKKNFTRNIASYYMNFNMNEQNQIAFLSIFLSSVLQSMVGYISTSTIAKETTNSTPSLKFMIQNTIRTLFYDNLDNIIDSPET